MSSYTPRSPYAGSSSIILTVVLLIITGVLAYGGVRLRHPLGATRPGLAAGVCIVVAWLLSVTSFLVALTISVQALHAQIGTINGPANPITPITVISGLIAFFVILGLTVPSVTSPVSQGQFNVALGSAMVETIAAPMIFELPYDLIVIGRTHPPSPWVLYTLLFFLPLFAVEILSFAMLTFSPFTKVSRITLFLLASMFLVFAVWAIYGFAYPSTPTPFALNALAKVLAFAAAVSLSIPQKRA